LLAGHGTVDDEDGDPSGDPLDVGEYDDCDAEYNGQVGPRWLSGKLLPATGGVS
jgi:hypothetical protein